MIAQTQEFTITSPDGSYNHDCCIDGKLIAKIEYDHSDGETQPWMVRVNGECFKHFDTYPRAESYVRWHYKHGTLPKWAVCEEVVEACTIEYCAQDDQGERYTYRINKVFSGYLSLTDKGWSNGNGDYYEDWRDAGIAPTRITRLNLVSLAA